MITVRHNLNGLNGVLNEYKRVSGLSTEQVLVKQGTKLGFELRDRLRRLKPNGITEERLSALQAGQGIRVRASIIRKVMASKGGAVSLADRMLHTGGRGRKNAASAGSGTRGVRFGFNSRNKQGRTKDTKGRSLWNLIVKRELSAREAGKGYTSTAGMMRIRNLAHNKVIRQLGRVSQELSNANISSTTEGGRLTLNYGGASYQGQPVELGESLNKPRARQAISEAINAVRKDIGLYLARKHREAIEGAVSKSVQAVGGAR